jgi:hypothetical protein
MTRGVLKENLPSKMCVTCNRPFTWRKKWERCWEEVSTCSKSCNAKRREAKRAEGGSDQQNEQEASEVPNNKQNAKAKIKNKYPDSDDGDDEEEDKVMGQKHREKDTSDEQELGKGARDHDPEVSREARKAQKKAAKAQKRAVREGRTDEDVGQKTCNLCSTRVDLLVRCTVDVDQQWKMVCEQCWTGVSGGVTDGDAEHPHYRYGGLWKNRT